MVPPSSRKTDLHTEGSAHTCCKDEFWTARSGVTYMDAQAGETGEDGDNPPVLCLGST